jgi:hypothetical protein
MEHSAPARKRRYWHGGGGRLGDAGGRTTGIRLAPDLSYVEGPAGERVAFTRSERRVLAALTRHRGRIVTREQLLDAIAGPGSDHGDRNIDFLINRLRRKLSDDARHPRFIATRYGEGYIWTGPAAGIDAGQADAYLVVGPLRGIGNLAVFPTDGRLGRAGRRLTPRFELRSRPQVASSNDRCVSGSARTPASEVAAAMARRRPGCLIAVIDGALVARRDTGTRR